MSAIIQASGLVKRYKDHLAVKNVNFSVEPGECFGILGPNGAGKTTVLRMVCCVSPVTSGELRVAGMDVRRKAGEIKRTLGVVPQENNLDPDLTVLQNLMAYARYFGLPHTTAYQRAIKSLELFQLLDRRNDRIDTLSGGMKRRLILARGLINNPEILVLDEPTTGLDPQARHFIWGRLRQLRSQGITVLISTHNMEEASRLCDRLIILNQGEIIASGSPEELVSRYVGREALEVAVDGASADAILQDTVAGPMAVQRTEDTLYIFGNDLEDFRQRLRENGSSVLYRPATLEDVFLRLTGRTLLEE